MTDDLLYLAIFLLGMAVGGALVALLHEDRWFSRHIADEAPGATESSWVPKDELPPAVAPKTENVQFDVTGKPRAVPWHIRKRELEAAHRTKRRRLESFREVD